MRRRKVKKRKKRKSQRKNLSQSLKKRRKKILPRRKNSTSKIQIKTSIFKNPFHLAPSRRELMNLLIPSPTVLSTIQEEASLKSIN